MAETVGAMRKVLLRIMTALVGAALMVGLVYLGGWYFGILVLCLGLLAQHEVYQLLARSGVHVWKSVGLVLGMLLAVRVLVPFAVYAAVLIVVVLLAWCPFARSEQPFVRFGATLLGAVYPTALLAFLTDLRLAQGDNLFILTLTVLLLVWATDIFAYVVGMLIGRHSMAPSISPKKTWEGAVGGVVGPLLIAIVLYLTIADFLGWVPHLDAGPVVQSG